jgi:hypothetical protein
MEELDCINIPLRFTTEEIGLLPEFFNPVESSPLSDSEASEIIMADPKLCLALAKSLIEQRRHRNRLFGTFGRFGEPEWDTLLDLYVARAGSVDVSLSSACFRTMIPAVKTALRYLSLMVEQGILESYQLPTNRRLTYVRLSDRSAVLMNRHLSYLVAQAA